MLERLSSYLIKSKVCNNAKIEELKNVAVHLKVMLGLYDTVKHYANMNDEWCFGDVEGVADQVLAQFRGLV